MSHNSSMASLLSSNNTTTTNIHMDPTNTTNTNNEQQQVNTKFLDTIVYNSLHLLGKLGNQSLKTSQKLFSNKLIESTLRDFHRVFAIYLSELTPERVARFSLFVNVCQKRFRRVFLGVATEENDDDDLRLEEESIISIPSGPEGEEFRFQCLATFNSFLTLLTSPHVKQLIIDSSTLYLKTAQVLSNSAGNNTRGGENEAGNINKTTTIEPVLQHVELLYNHTVNFLADYQCKLFVHHFLKLCYKYIRLCGSQEMVAAVADIVSHLIVLLEESEGRKKKGAVENRRARAELLEHLNSVRTFIDNDDINNAGGDDGKNKNFESTFYDAMALPDEDLNTENIDNNISNDNVVVDVEELFQKHLNVKMAKMYPRAATSVGDSRGVKAAKVSTQPHKDDSFSRGAVSRTNLVNTIEGISWAISEQAQRPFVILLGTTVACFLLVIILWALLGVVVLYMIFTREQQQPVIMFHSPAADIHAEL